MNIKVSKITKNGANKKELIIGDRISFGAGHSSTFWWNLHFVGKDKNGLHTDVEIVLDEEERIKFINDFSLQVEKWKKTIEKNNHESK
jgi:hypothetical protein